MSAVIHPSETTLLDYAGGALKPGARLVVSSHLETCASCRADVGSLEAAAGLLMASLEPVKLEDDALALALARIERPPPPPRAAPTPQVSTILKDVDVPAALRRAEIGPTRWMAPGIRVAKIRGADPGEKLYLLRVASGMRMPHHGHDGIELTYVLKGAFSDAEGHYGVGDLAETTTADVHTPLIDKGGDCVCLVAAEGEMQMREWLPRMLQPFFGL
jgi:putative transcriptional regulator